MLKRELISHSELYIGTDVCGAIGDGIVFIFEEKERLREKKEKVYIILSIPFFISTQKR